ncbi:TetR/AcrR family transcriptional regulator [Brevibacillus fluminis]|uniref:TetR/AcrR family transcriptional regulator n=1 Tax=Brevibacillus fluminis TaxID=511487 RepID=A0A3M8DAF3_9BACL|nr:TetR/AcrR family transcriptional regulator [Brevibacillus fluminis]RNB84569.1 TetR/AcrR family transcriptional regulator [Brevibacillus fluminis]
MPKLGMEEKRKADVIDAALTCISAYGIDGMTLERVAEFANCSKGVIAYYFKNKENLTIEAFKAFLAYYGKKIEYEIDRSMTSGEMLDVVLKHILPPYCDDQEKKIHVSELDGVECMYIPYEDQAKLFVQFFSKTALDPKLQEIASESYQRDFQGIAKIIDSGNKKGAIAPVDPQSTAYGILAMAVGLSFFRAANIPLPFGGDNRKICEDYVKRLCGEESIRRTEEN